MSQHQSRYEIGSKDVRWMIRRDLPEVSKLALASGLYLPGTTLEEIGEDLVLFLRQRNCIGKVCSDGVDGKILSFVLYWLEAGKRITVFMSGGDVENLDPILQKLIAKQRHLWISVTESNLELQLRLRWYGFRCREINKFEDEEDDYQFHLRPSKEKING